MEDNNSTAATEQAKDPFAGFDNVHNELGEEVGFKSTDQMPKTEASHEGFKDIEKELNGETVEEKKPEAKPDKETPNEVEKEVIQDKDADKGKTDDKQAKELTDDDKAPELEFDPEKFKFENPETGAESESSWVDLGKDLGIEIKENSFEAYKEAFDKVRTDAIEAGKKEAARIELEKFTPEAQKAIEFLNANPEASINDFINPLKRIDEALSLDNESLLRADFVAKGWDADRIDERVQILSDNGTLESEAYVLRKDIENVRANTEMQLVEDAKAQGEYRRQQIQETQRKENESIIKVIQEVKTFMGFKVPDAAKQYLQKQWESGEVRKAFQSNPEEVVQFMLNKYIGKEAERELRKNQFQKGRDEIQSKLHNTKELNTTETSGRREPKQAAKAGAGAFDAWADITTDNATVDTNGY
jgi:hypothetical protein